MLKIHLTGPEQSNTMKFHKNQINQSEFVKYLAVVPTITKLKRIFVKISGHEHLLNTIND